MNDIQFDFDIFNINHNSKLFNAITNLIESNQTLFKQVQELTKENEILKATRLSPQSNNDGNECLRLSNDSYFTHMTLIDSHPSFGGHDMRGIIFSFLSKDDYKSIYE